MEKLLTNKTVSLTEFRDPAKVFEQAGDAPVAILNRNTLVGYFVPKAAVQPEFEMASRVELLEALDTTGETDQPVLDYLRDK